MFQVVLQVDSMQPQTTKRASSYVVCLLNGSATCAWHFACGLAFLTGGLRKVLRHTTVSRMVLAMVPSMLILGLGCSLVGPAKHRYRKF